MSSLAPWMDANRSGMAPEGTPPPRLSALDTIGEAVVHRSPIVGMANALRNRVWALADPDEPGFDPMAQPLPQRLEPYRYRFNWASSQKEFDRLARQLDEQRRGLEQVARAEGGLRFMAETVAAFADPAVLVPPAKAASYGAALGRNLVRYGAAETASQSVQLGTGRQEPAETLTNIAVASALGGTLGAFVGGKGTSAYREVVEGLDEVDRAVDAKTARDRQGSAQPAGRQGPVEFDPDGTVTGVGRREQGDPMEFAGDPRHPADVVGMERAAYEALDEPARRRAHRDFLNANPERSDELFDALRTPDEVRFEDPNFARDLEDQQLARALGLEGIPMGPLFRLSKASVEIPEIQRTVQGLVGLEGMFTRGNLRGRPSETGVFARSKQWQGRAVEVRKTLDDLFLEDRGRDPNQFAAQMRQWWSDGFNGVPSGKLDRGEWNRQVTTALLRHGEHPNPQIKKAAAEVRRLYDEMRDQAVETGVVEKGFDEFAQEGYVPRVWRVDVIEARMEEFVDRLARWWSENGRDGGEPMPWEQARQAAAQAADDIVHKHDPFHRFDPDVTGQATAAYARKIDAPSSIFLDEAGGDFIETNIEGITQHYARAMGTDIELSRRFGSVSMKDQLAKIREQFLSKRLEPKRQEGYRAARERGLDHNAAMAEGNKAANAFRESAEYQQAVKRVDEMIQDLRDTRDRVRGTYGLPDDPFRPLSRGIRVAKQFNAMAYLGLATTSALVDVARPIMVEGIHRTWKHSLGPMMRGIDENVYRMSAKELRLAGTALDLVLSQRALAFADLGDVYAMRSGFERTMTDATNRFFQLTGLNHWTTFMKEWSGMVVMNRIKETLDDLAAGTIADGDRAALARVGLTDEMGARVKAMLDEHGEMATSNRDGELKDGVWLPNTERWGDAEARRAFRAALQQEVDRTIITPGIGERPHFTSSEFGSILLQFKSFAMASQSRMLIGGMQDPQRTKFLTGVAVLIAAGMMADSVRDRVRGRQRSRDLKERISRGVDRSGMLGWFADVNNAIESFSDNAIGLRPLIGEAHHGDNSWQWKVGTFGPSASTLANTITAAHYMGAGGGPMSWEQASAIRKLVPGNNLWFATRAFDELPTELMAANRWNSAERQWNPSPLPAGNEIVLPR